MLSIDGSTLEGGGQLVRVCLSLSAICDIPVRISRIRASRSSKGVRPDKRHQQRSGINGSARGQSSTKRSTAAVGGGGGGLKESHLAALEWLASQCDAETVGAEVGSSEIVFRPSKRERMQIPEREWTIELKNPGSVWLIWQAIFPFVVFCLLDREPEPPGDIDELGQQRPKHVQFTLRGGTNVSKSMSSEYVTQVFQPVCHKIGLPDVRIEVPRRGWAGSAPEIGEARITVPLPSKDIAATRSPILPAFQARERGKITKITITVLAGSESMRKMTMAKTMELLSDRIRETDIEVEIELDENSGDERRLYVLLVAHTANGWRLGRDHLGGGKKILKDLDRRRVVDEAAESVVSQLLREIQRGGCVDEYMQDQLVVFQALANGESHVDAGVRMKGGSASLHTRTVRWVCEEMLEELGVRLDEEGGCEGIGWNHVRDGVEDLTGQFGAVEIDG